MINIKLLLLSYWIVISAVVGNSWEKIQWEKIETDFNEQLSYVGGNSKNNFWLQNVSNMLLHIEHNKVKTYTPPSNLKFLETNYFRISDNHFFCATINSQWQGEIYNIYNNIWTRFNITTSVPIRHFYQTANGNLFLTGDFGLLLKFNNNEWEIIKTPFKSHIIKAEVNANKLYLATRNNGIVLFENNNFTFLSKKYKTTKDVKIIDGILYAFTINNRIIEITDTIESEVNNSELLKYFIPENSSKFGFAERNIIYNNEKIEIIFPQDYNIFPTNRGNENVIVLQDSSIILLSSVGDIFISKKEKDNYFTNLALLYRIDDLPASNNTGVRFFDANNDGTNELLVLNKNYGNYLTLYQGVKNSAFANITSISNLPGKDNQILHFTVSDFNKDNLVDLVFELHEKSLFKLIFYQNFGNFKFKRVKEIILPTDFQTMGLRDLTSYDYDKDGDEDIIATAYYGKEDKPGYILIYQNNRWGNFSQIDTTFKSFTQKWNQKTIFADVNNDNILDIFSAVQWHKDHLFLGTNNGFNEISSSNLPKPKRTETIDALLSDFDNDADLDIITIGGDDFIRIYTNNGNGKFADKTSQLFDNNYLNNPKLKNTNNLTLGDFNNDSYTDILVSLNYTDTNYTTFFISDSGKGFEQTPINIENREFVFSNCTISDFDNDGDLDIYGTTKKHNMFLINRLDNNKYIKIKLNGIISSTLALGSKVWLYKNGHLEDNHYLIGFKELGTDVISPNKANDLILHFGLGNNEKCDIKILFPSGKKIVKKGVVTGSFLTVNELPFVYALIYKLPGNFYRFLTTPQNQIYILVILISHLIHILGLWYGFTKLNLSIKLILIFTVLNLSLFWLTLYYSSLSESNYFKFLTPFTLTFLGTIIPLAITYWLKKINTKNYYAYNDKLLELMMSFSHGEWALRNLNSIILLCENPPQNWGENLTFKSKLKKRLDTFLEMTLAAIKEIITYEKLVNNNNEELTKLEETATATANIITQLKNNSTLPNLNQLTYNLTDIRHNIRKLRNSVYSRFSSKPTEIINNLVDNFGNTLEENSIIVKKEKLYQPEIPVLIRNYELGNILDNLMQNSIRSMKQSERRIIKISLLKKSPKIVINFSNTGTPIPKEKWETIFQQGYSENNSTGYGLFSAKETLKKYDGRIYISESNPQITTFTIELNEGSIYKHRNFYERK